jgi:hypothetical protein
MDAGMVEKVAVRGWRVLPKALRRQEVHGIQEGFMNFS